MHRTDLNRKHAELRTSTRGSAACAAAALGLALGTVVSCAPEASDPESVSDFVRDHGAAAGEDVGVALAALEESEFLRVDELDTDQIAANTFLVKGTQGRGASAIVPPPPQSGGYSPNGALFGAHAAFLQNKSGILAFVEDITSAIAPAQSIVSAVQPQAAALRNDINVARNEITQLNAQINARPTPPRSVRCENGSGSAQGGCANRVCPSSACVAIRGTCQVSIPNVTPCGALSVQVTNAQGNGSFSCGGICCMCP